MKNSARRPNSFRSPSSDPSAASAASSGDSPLKSPSSLFWLVLHGLCCVVSLLLGFRFSRFLFLLLFSSPSPSPSPPVADYVPVPLLPAKTLTLTLPPKLTTIATSPNLTASRVVVGRHGILIRPWPHPHPVETMKAHRIMERVQQEQRIQYGVKSPRPVIVVTPTYVRTFQTLHLTGLMHTLMLVHHDLTWIVVEAGGISNETGDLLAQSKLRTIHIGFDQEMPLKWSDRHKIEALMRIEALRVVRDRKLDGIVVFADDSNMHSLDLFDEIQKVKWVGAVSVGILAHSGNSDPLAQSERSEEVKENMPVPIQGPACNLSNQLVGWHTFNSLPFVEKSATFVGDVGTVLPTKMEWAGFVLNSRLVWREADYKPNWARDLDSVGANGEEIKSPLVLLKDAAFVEPLGSCGKKVMLWWLRVEARSDSKFPPGWIIDPPLDITVPAKRTPWPDAPPELPSEKLSANQDHVDKHSSKMGRSRSRHSSRSKRKHEQRVVKTQVTGVSRRQEDWETTRKSFSISSSKQL